MSPLRTGSVRVRENDEARMLNDETSPKHESRRTGVSILHLIIRHSFELRHSDFVIWDLRWPRFARQE